MDGLVFLCWLAITTMAAYEKLGAEIADDGNDYDYICQLLIMTLFLPAILWDDLTDKKRRYCVGCFLFPVFTLLAGEAALVALSQSLVCAVVLLCCNLAHWCLAGGIRYYVNNAA